VSRAYDLLVVEPMARGLSVAVDVVGLAAVAVHHWARGVAETARLVAIVTRCVP
jgi:hypothetical protein